MTPAEMIATGLLDLAEGIYELTEGETTGVKLIVSSQLYHKLRLILSNKPMFLENAEEEMFAFDLITVVKDKENG